jgi:hypothetical protein
MQSLVNFAHAVGETITPVLTETAFMEKGESVRREMVAVLCGEEQGRSAVLLSLYPAVLLFFCPSVCLSVCLSVCALLNGESVSRGL